MFWSLGSCSTDLEAKPVLSYVVATVKPGYSTESGSTLVPEIILLSTKQPEPELERVYGKHLRKVTQGVALLLVLASRMHEWESGPQVPSNL